MIRRILEISILSFIMAAASWPALAGLKVCNETNSTRSLAIAYSDQKVWKSEGWWIIKPGQCKLVVSGALKQRYYYYRATTTSGAFSGDEYYFCTAKKPFTITGEKGCKKRGYGRSGFRKIDTGKKAKNFKLTLTRETAKKPEEGFKPGTHGEPITVTGSFQGCRSQHGSTFCEIMTDEWVYVVPKDNRTPKAVYASLKAVRFGASVTLEGDIVGYGDVTADIALRKITLNAPRRSADGRDDLLRGGWRSLDDSQSSIRFEKGAYYSYYDGELTDKGENTGAIIRH